VGSSCNFRAEPDHSIERPARKKQHPCRRPPFRASMNSVSIEDRRQISSILSYLSEFHGFEGIQSWFGESLKRTRLRRIRSTGRPSAVASLMESNTSESGKVRRGIHDPQCRPGAARDIGGYARMLRGQRLYEDRLQGIPEGDVRLRIWRAECPFSSSQLETRAAALILSV